MNQQPSQPHDSRSLIAIFLCIVFYLAYQKYISWKYPDLNKSSSTSSDPVVNTASPEAKNSVTASDTPTASKDPIFILPDDQLIIENETTRWFFSQKLGGLHEVTLKNYRSQNGQDSPPVNLLDSPMTIQAHTTNTDSSVPLGPFHASREGQTIKMWQQQGAFKVTQEFAVPESGYIAHLKVTYENTSETSVNLYGSIRVEEYLKPQKASSILGFIPGVVTHQDQVVVYADNSGQWSPVKDFCDSDDGGYRGAKSSLKYLGIDRHYFLALLIPKAEATNYAAYRLPAVGSDCGIGFIMGYDLGTIEKGQSFSMDYDIYMGPKDIHTLSTSNPMLSSAMHLGFFDFIARPLMIVIDSFYSIFKNYGLAIIFLTILLKVLFYPLVKASQVSMHQMKKLNPQMAEIREKWKDDKSRQQQELLKFMSQHKINPMKGCLPILPQIPVFFAFYQVLQTSINLRHAPFFGWITDLSAMDPLLITPLLMGVAMFIQQKMTPTTGMDKTQERILLFMPIMFTAMMLTLPAGLTLYMLTNTVVGIGQQRWLMKRLDSNQAK